MRGQRDDMREQRDRWQAQAERLAALAITDPRREAALRSLSPGGDGCEPRRATSSFYGLWAACVEEFCWSP